MNIMPMLAEAGDDFLRLLVTVLMMADTDTSLVHIQIMRMKERTLRYINRSNIV